MKVSWQVTGIPKDLWAKAHPMTVEQEKAASLVAISMPNSMASRKRKVFHLIYWRVRRWRVSAKHRTSPLCGSWLA